MTVTFGASAIGFVRAGPVEPSRPAATALSERLQVKPIGLARLQGSFVSPQALYADSQRIFAGSYQGDLFILERDRGKNFPWIQTITLGSPLTAVSGNEDYLYVAGRDGNLYVFTKTWPVQLTKTIPLSNYGLGAVHVVAGNVYVAKGQASMAASDRYLYLSPLNPGDVGLEVSNRRVFEGEEFEPGQTLAFDRQTLQLVGTIPNSHPGAICVGAWQDFVFLTTPGCCGTGIDIIDAKTLERVQFINRSTNSVAAIQKSGVSLLVGGTESGAVDWHVLGSKGYQFAGTVDLRRLTGFTGPEDIEIRALWVDGLDNLIFAGSSWGNDHSRSPDLPSLFFLEIVF